MPHYEDNVHFVLKIFLIFVTSACVYGCHNNPVKSNAQIPDPYEKFNRHVFAFNNFIDQYALEPVATHYNTLTPTALRLLIRNELDYFQSPVSIVNSLLQGDIDVFLHVTGRFFINTTLGGLGLLDPASDFGLKSHQEDFGQTLAVWGVPVGRYYMAPFLGPLTLRDVFGKLTDIAITPTTYMGDDIATLNIANTAVGLIDFRAYNIDTVNNLKASTPDFYALIRTIFVQKREAAIKNTDLHSNIQKEPEFLDFDDEF
jgi:phospholipid-binding lipoprotein MlaA